MDFHLKRGEGGWKLRRRMPVHGSMRMGGKKLKACERKERQDTEAIFIDLLYLCCFAFPPLCNTKPTQGSSNYKILMWTLHIVVLQWQDGICIVQI